MDLAREHLSWCPIGLGGWWEGSPLLGGERVALEGGHTDIALSERLRSKPWRKIR